MLELSYILLSIIMVSLIIFGHFICGFRFYQSKEIARNKTLKVALFLAMVLLYLSTLSYFNILTTFDMPPRFPIFLVVPFLSFCIYFYLKNKQNAFIQSIPLHWTAFYQTFRIFVETILLYTFYKGIIPVEATFEGYNFDILWGITAIPIGFLILKTERKYLRLIRAWNVVGIFMILAVAITIGLSFYAPEVIGYNEPATKFAFLKMPYLLIAGFLAPSAIFIHIVSLIQLNKN